MSKRNRTASRPGQHRQTIRQVLDEVPADLLVSTDTNVAAYQPPMLERNGHEQAPQRRGWLGLGFRHGRAKGQAAAAAAPQHPVFEVERRVQRLEEALAGARAEVRAASRDVEEARRRVAGAEGQLASEREARGHWQRVSTEQLSALDELGAQHSAVSADLHAEREAHEQTRAQAAGVEGQLTAQLAQWEQHATELTGTLQREREDFQRTLEDERHTAEVARAEQAFQHREQVERLQAEAGAAIAALQQKLADAHAGIETVNAELGATRAEVVRLHEDVEAARGEAVAATTRAREADELRLGAEQRIEEMGEELAYVRSEVMGAEGGRKKPKGLFGRGRPAPVKAAEKQTRAAMMPNDVAAPPVDPDVEDIIERRLFGSA
jgi:chromosome segregation ATPase